MIKNKLVLLIGGLTIMLLLSGCFGFGGDSISIPVGENGESISFGGDEEEGFSFEAEGKDGESFSISSSKEIPEELPDDIPFPGEYQLISSAKVNQDGTEGITVAYITENMSVDELWDLYMNYMNESEFESISEMKTDGYNTLQMAKDNISLGLSFIADEENGVQVNMSYTKREESSQ